ncbi:MAG: hypothetical protein OER78_00480 [Nitrosopumilus sp.]|nr:hypothetical protein [Nitrosopumilus sp.]MDH3854622.1 hypothetical protein [Nitrosopumilus sp.]
MKSIGFLIFFLGAILISGTFVSQSFADVISPRQQMKLDFTAEQVICSEGLVKIIKSSSGKVSCVKPTTAEKLAQNGWAKQLSEQKLEEIKTKKVAKGEPAGTIEKIATLKQLSKKGITGTSTSISGYAYVFEACSNSKIIRAPEIYVTSDSEAKSVKLGSMIKADSCYTSSVIIKAADPASIDATLLNKGGISQKILSLENQIADLKNRISAAKQKIPLSDEQKLNPENLNNITSMKKELKNLQDQLRRYLMVLYVPPNVKVSKIDIPKSITGKPLDGMSTNLISVTESVGKLESGDVNLKRFNVVFEACTGKESVRLPIIYLISDSDYVDVKLINRIISNSCQVGFERINAIDSETIIAQISGNSGVSKQISGLEKQIDDLKNSLDEKRKTLSQLLSKKLDSSGEESAVKLALDISQLRTDLLEARTQVNGLMLGV